MHLCSQCFDQASFLSNWGQNCTTEFRVAYFSPESKRMKKIYSKDLIDYQIEISKSIFSDFSIWLDVDYMTKKGHSENLHDSTRIWIVPIALGLNYNFLCYQGWNAYLGAGGNYTHLKIHDHSHYVKEHISKWDFGGTFKLGIKKIFCNGITLNIFCDYFLQKFHFSNSSHCSYQSSSSCYIERHCLNLNGLKAGIGLGYSF